MTTQIKVLRENVIKALSSVKDDNVSIADVIISRQSLLAALKLQTQEDMLTLSYGKVAWQADGSKYDNDLEPETCIQFSCNHTIMRFLNRPANKHHYGEPKVKALNFVDYRAETVKPELTGIALDTIELLNALNFVIHGVNTDGSRLVLECILFDCTKNKLTLVTADGFRLPVATMAIKGMTKKQALINRSDIPKLLTFLKSNTEGKGKYKSWLDTYLTITKTSVKFMSDKGTVEFDNQEGTYPNYGQLIPESGTHIQLIASEMLQSVKALNTIAKDGSGIIRLNFTKYPDKLTLSAKSEDLGNSQVECQAMVDRPCYIAVNAKYLIDYLTSCKDGIIDLFIDKASSPMVCHNGLDQFEIIMPMFVQW